MVELYEYYDTLFDGILKNTFNKGTRLLFCDTNETVELSFYFDLFFDKHKNIKVIRYHVDENQPKHPYAPFFNIIKSLLPNNITEKALELIMEKANVYPVHRKLLISYILNKPIIRTEDILEDELQYEKDSMYQNIYKLLVYVAGKKELVIVIENIEALIHSSISFLKVLSNKKKLRGKILFIFCFNKIKKSIDVEKDYALDFINQLERSDDIVNLYFKKLKTDAFSSDIKNEPIYAIDRTINLCIDHFNLLSFNDCNTILNKLYSWIVTKKVSITDKEMLTILKMLSESSFYIGDIDTALINAQNYLSYANKSNSKKDICQAYLVIGEIHDAKFDTPEAEKNYNIAGGIARELDDTYLIFRVDFLLFVIEQKARKLDAKEWEKAFKNVTQQAKNLEMEQSLAYCYTNPFGILSNYDNKFLKLHNEGISIAKKYKNTFRLAKSYQTKGMIFAVKGLYNVVLIYYQKSNKLAKKLRNKLYIAQSYNGLGFYNYMTGNYYEANKSYYKALYYLKDVRDYYEIVMTYFNIASNFFLSFEHELAIQYLDNMMELMTLFNMKNLAYHSRFGIFSLQGVVQYCLGREDKAYQYYTKIRANKLKPYKSKNEEFFLYEMLNAFIQESRKNYKRARFHLNKACKYLNSENDIIKYFTPRYYYEYGRICKKEGSEEEAISVFKEGLAKSKQLKYKYYIKVFSELISGKKEIKRIDFEYKLIPFKIILESAKLEENINKLHKRMNEINLLNALQSIFEKRGITKRELFEKSIEMVKNNLFVEKLCYSFLEDQSKESKKCDHEDEHTHIKKLFKGIKSCKILYRHEIAGLNLSSIVYIPVYVNNSLYAIVTFATIKDEYTYDYNDFKIFTIIFKQIENALEKIVQEEEIIKKNSELKKANKQLYLSATTDPLTGVYNRGALYKKISEEEQRLSKTSYDNSASMVVIFLDLDNFKFYNDNFGHDVGDQVLQKFADILKKQFNKNSFIVRYGGDEFTIIMSDTPPEKALSIAKKVVTDVNKQNSFLYLAEENLKQSIQIPNKKKLTCSIGISSITSRSITPENSKESIRKLFKYADEALYKAKEQGKNRAFLFEENK